MSKGIPQFKSLLLITKKRKKKKTKKKKIVGFKLEMRYANQATSKRPFAIHADVNERKELEMISINGILINFSDSI